jgi:hypothetical protein
MEITGGVVVDDELLPCSDAEELGPAPARRALNWPSVTQVEAWSGEPGLVICP